MNRFKIELIGQDKTKINAMLYERGLCDAIFVKDLVRIDVVVEPGTVDFLRRNKVFYLKVLDDSISTFNDEESQYVDQWVKLKQRIKKCNRCERLKWKVITFIAKTLTSVTRM